MGNPLVPLALFGWIPVVLYIFGQYRPQRAVITSFIVAWLFLPLATIPLPGIPDITKMNVTCYGILLATGLNDSERLQSFKFSWIDIPMAVWCIVCPVASALTNDLQLYDGLSAGLDQTMSWGGPYFLGRLYLNTFDAMKKLAIGIFIGGLVYAPLCLFEARMFTNIHGLVYGFIVPSASFLISLRYGGYRPAVFMESGLMVGVWMMLATLLGIVLWRAKIVKRLFGMSMGTLVALLLITFILVKATGAYNLLALSLITLFVAKWFRTSIVLWLITAGMIVFMQLGVTGEFPRAQIIGALNQVFSADRIQSVDFRFMNEELLSAKARQRATFGWGGFGRNRIFDEYGKDISITDSLWIIVFGQNGVVGLVSIFSAILLPPIAFSIRFPARLWSHPRVAPAAALVVGLVMYGFDCVLNAMINPIFALVCGGVAGLVLNPKPNVIEPD